ncbi:hypothetical protein LINPERPRIM_LOCUS31447 [Linum perenne]
MPQRDVVSWTALKSGFASKGCGDDAAGLYCVMRNEEEKLRVAVSVSKAALQFIQGLSLSSDYTVLYPRRSKQQAFRFVQKSWDQLLKVMK